MSFSANKYMLLKKDDRTMIMLAKRSVYRFAPALDDELFVTIMACKHRKLPCMEVPNTASDAT